MPLLTYVLTVPPNTAESAPVRLDAVIGFNWLLSLGVLFPDGCLNSTGVFIALDGVRVAPLPAGWIRGNNIYFEWLEERNVYDAGLLSMFGYSIAEDYSHSPVFYLKVK